MTEMIQWTLGILFTILLIVLGNVFSCTNKAKTVPKNEQKIKVEFIVGSTNSHGPIYKITIDSIDYIIYDHSIIKHGIRH